MTPLDLNHTATKRALFSQSIAAQVDAANPGRIEELTTLYARIESEPLPLSEDRPGRSVSASAIGDECARRVQLNIWVTFHPSARAPKKAPLDDKTRRIFLRGHETETLVAKWLMNTGYDLLTRTGNDTQFGFSAADGQIKGYADGVIRNFVSDITGWEHKTVNNKGWRSVAKHGLLKTYPKYDAQAQLLMAYLELPAMLVSLLNADTHELWFELQPFNQTRAQDASDRAVRILQATRAGDLLPCAASSGDVFPCKFCQFREECWG